MDKKAESRRKYLAKNTAIFAIGSIATRLITFFLVPLYTNVLTESEYGVIDLINTICSVLAPVIILNINEAIMRFSLDRDANYEKIMSIGLTILGAAFIFGTAIIPASSLFEETSPYCGYIYLYTVSSAASILFLAYLRGKERLILFSVGNILHTFSIAVLNIFFLVVIRRGVQGYFLAYILANLITGIYAAIAGDVKKVVRHFCLDIGLAKAMSKYSFVLIPNTFMWWITNSSDRIMVTSMIGTAANGIYAVSYKLPTIVQTVSVIFNQAWSYSAIRENTSEDREEYNNSVYRGVAGLSIISAVGLMSIIKPFLKVYVGAGFFEAWKYTPYLIIGYVFLTLGSFLGTSYTVNKDSMGYLASGSCGAAVNIILNFVFIPVLGIAGAALATCISYVAVFVYRCFDTKKYIRIEVLNWKHMIAWAVMLLTAATMFINSTIGQAALFIEFGIELILLHDAWIPIVISVLRKLRS